MTKRSDLDVFIEKTREGISQTMQIRGRWVQYEKGTNKPLRACVIGATMVGCGLNIRDIAFDLSYITALAPCIGIDLNKVWIIYPAKNIRFPDYVHVKVLGDAIISLLDSDHWTRTEIIRWVARLKDEDLFDSYEDAKNGYKPKEA